jgi:hypothetical protein
MKTQENVKPPEDVEDARTNQDKPDGGAEEKEKEKEKPAQKKTYRLDRVLKKHTPESLNLSVPRSSGKGFKLVGWVLFKYQKHNVAKRADGSTSKWTTYSFCVAVTQVGRDGQGATLAAGDDPTAWCTIRHRVRKVGDVNYLELDSEFTALPLSGVQTITVEGNEATKARYEATKVGMMITFTNVCGKAKLNETTGKDYTDLKATGIEVGEVSGKPPNDDMPPYKRMEELFKYVENSPVLNKNALLRTLAAFQTAGAMMGVNDDDFDASLGPVADTSHVDQLQSTASSTTRNHLLNFIRNAQNVLSGNVFDKAEFERTCEEMALHVDGVTAACATPADFMNRDYNSPCVLTIAPMVQNMVPLSIMRLLSDLSQQDEEVSLKPQANTLVEYTVTSASRPKNQKFTSLSVGVVGVPDKLFARQTMLEQPDANLAQSGALLMTSKAHKPGELAPRVEMAVNDSALVTVFGCVTANTYDLVVEQLCTRLHAVVGCTLKPHKDTSGVGGRVQASVVNMVANLPVTLAFGTVELSPDFVEKNLAINKLQFISHAKLETDEPEDHISRGNAEDREKYKHPPPSALSMLKNGALLVSEQQSSPRNFQDVKELADEIGGELRFGIVVNGVKNAIDATPELSCDSAKGDDWFKAYVERQEAFVKKKESKSSYTIQDYFKKDAPNFALYAYVYDLTEQLKYMPDEDESD